MGHLARKHINYSDGIRLQNKWEVINLGLIKFQSSIELILEVQWRMKLLLGE